VLLTFTGTAIDWVALKATNYGMARVTLDASAPVMVNLYSATPAYKQAVYSRSGLSAGPHTLKIEWTGLKGGPGGTTGGDFVNFDAFDIVGVLTTAPAYPIRFEQNDERLLYSGSSWTTATGSLNAYSGGSLRWARGAKTSVTFTFDGTAVSWIAMKAANYGLARVTIDGSIEPTVSLYAATTAYQRPVFTRTGLSTGTHTMRIEWLGLRDTGGGGDLINIDAIEVSGVLTGP
jgi:hypothetical protein